MLQPIEIKARRLYLHMNQTEFAEKLKISRQYLSRLESGRERISQSFEKKYDKLFGTERLISTMYKRGIECPNCYITTPPKKLSGSKKDELDEVYQCPECNYIFTVGESWGLHYRPQLIRLALMGSNPARPTTRFNDLESVAGIGL